LTAKPPTDVWQTLKCDISDARKQKLETAAKKRTNYIRLVVQDVHDPHNVSACLRSAEAMGIQKVDVVTLNQPYRTSTVSRGVKNWLEISTHSTVKGCAEQLRAEGFLICAGMPSPDSVPLDNLPVNVDKPLALLFGNENADNAADWKEYVDLYFTIPMSGLVESMNISVSAAIALHHMTHKARTELGVRYYLSDKQISELLNHWAVKTIDNWEKRYERIKNS